jgi:hypothetical protein
MSFGSFAFGGSPIASEILREREYRGQRIYRGKKTTMKSGSRGPIMKLGTSLTTKGSSTILKS